MRKYVLAFLFSLLFLTPHIVAAQEWEKGWEWTPPPEEELEWWEWPWGWTRPPPGMKIPEWAKALGPSWIILLVLSLVILVAGLGFRKPLVLSIGTALLFVGLILVAVVAIFPYWFKPVLEFDECKVLFPDVKWLTFEGFLGGVTHTVSCVLTGYVPSKIDPVYAVAYLIFGLALPIIVFTSVFWDVLPDVIEKRVRKAITVAGVLFAYRGFVAAYFIHLFVYGFAGVLAIGLSGIIATTVWRAATRYVRPLGVPITQELRLMALGEAEAIRRQIENLRAARDVLTREGKEKEAAEVAEKIENLAKRLAELEKRGY